MIDPVQRACERFAPELESYKERKIFTPREINKIVETRRLHEMKINKTARKARDFYRYTESEKVLEKLRNQRISKSCTDMAETDRILSQNIVSIYKRALHHFDEPIFLKELAEYCVKKRLYEDMKEFMATLCLKKPADTDLWIYCARKLEEINDIESARILFLKGEGVNKSTRLLIEFFRFECAYMEKVVQMNEELGIEDEDDIGSGEAAREIFKRLRETGSEEEISECIEIAGRFGQDFERRLIQSVDK